jgi:hypothetical protein
VALLNVLYVSQYGHHGVHITDSAPKPGAAQSRRSPDSTDHRFVVGTVAAAETQPLNPAQRAAAHHHLIPQTTDLWSELPRKVNQEINVECWSL